MIFCCFFGGAYVLFRRFQSTPRTAWENPVVDDTGAQAPQMSARLNSMRTSVPGPAVQIRTPTAFTPVTRPK
jgi:hypothetical protein